MPEPIFASSVIFKKCFKKCVKLCIPGRGCKKKCVEACVSIELSNGKLYLVISVEGRRARYDLAKAEFVYSYGIGSIKVRVTDIGRSPSGRINSVRLLAEVCIGTTIFGYPVEKCWDVYEDTIRFLTLENPKTGEPDLYAAYA